MLGFPAHHRPSHPGLSQSTELRPVLHSSFYWLSTLHVVAHIHQRHSPSSSHPLHPPLCPQVHSSFKTYSAFSIACHCHACQRRQWHPTPVPFPGKSHGQRNLVGCSPRGRKESDTTERLHFHFSLSCIGGGNGNPLQCSCLENPRDRGAWWAAGYGVA